MTQDIDIEDIALSVARKYEQENITGITFCDSMVEFATRFLAAIDAKRAELNPPVGLEYPTYHPEGMGCGLEDRCITDRYEAMRYGFEEALDQMDQCNPGPLFTYPPAPQSTVPDGWKPTEKEILEYGRGDGQFGLFADEGDALAIANGVLELVQLKINRLNASPKHGD